MNKITLIAVLILMVGCTQQQEEKRVIIYMSETDSVSMSRDSVIMYIEKFEAENKRLYQNLEK